MSSESGGLIDDVMAVALVRRGHRGGQLVVVNIVCLSAQHVRLRLLSVDAEEGCCINHRGVVFHRTVYVVRANLLLQGARQHRENVCSGKPVPEDAQEQSTCHCAT